MHQILCRYLSYLCFWATQFAVISELEPVCAIGFKYAVQRLCCGHYAMSVLIPMTGYDVDCSKAVGFPDGVAFTFLFCLRLELLHYTSINICIPCFRILVNACHMKKNNRLI